MGVDGVVFTGATATGRKIAGKWALRPDLLEPGGDGPFIIMALAVIDKAVEGAISGCFRYSGQVCTSTERLPVHEAVHEEFVKKFRIRARQQKIGNPADEAAQMGPLCTAATLARVRAHVEGAHAKGAQIEQIGPDEGLCYPATLLTGVTSNMLIAQKETFGPVPPIIRIALAEKAIRNAHQTGPGLIASLGTRDLATAWQVGKALPRGSVNINETSNPGTSWHPLAEPDCPVSNASSANGSWKPLPSASCWPSTWATPPATAAPGGGLVTRPGPARPGQASSGRIAGPSRVCRTLQCARLAAAVRDPPVAKRRAGTAIVALGLAGVDLPPLARIGLRMPPAAPRPAIRGALQRGRTRRVCAILSWRAIDRFA